MKKISLVSGALLAALAVSGCSCSKTGEYSFEYIEYKNSEDKTVKFKCSEDELKGLSAGEELAMRGVCSAYKEIKFTLNKDGSMKTGDTESGYWKIEDGQLLTAATKDGKYEKIADYKKGRVVIGEEKYKVYFVN